MTKFAVGDQVRHVRVWANEIGTITEVVSINEEPFYNVSWLTHPWTRDPEDALILVNPTESLISGYAQYYQAITEGT